MDFATPLIVVFVAIAVWWLSTGIVLAVVNHAEKGGSRLWKVMVPMTFVGAIGFILMLIGSRYQTSLGSYTGFFGALLVWAWHEAAFLTGMLTGSRRTGCPAGLRGWARFRAAWEAVCDHEIALLLTGIGLWFALAGSANLFGLAAFALLWVMRISAKLVIFLGAPHAISEMMPRRIAHLKSYFNTDKTTPLFPLVLAIATGLLAVLVIGAQRATEDHSVVGHTLLATFMALAIIEHLVLVLPVSDTALWRWAMAKPAVEKATADARLEDLGRLGRGPKHPLNEQ